MTSKITPELWTATADGQPASFLVILAEQADLGARLLAVLSFLGIQAAFWGLMLFPLVAGLWRGARGRIQASPLVHDRAARAR